MLTLRSIEVEDFGPFVGRQVVEIPDDGVTVVYGENARGKTSLLNAIRYAFYGKVLQRGARERQLHTISNREKAAQGQYGFKVVLSFNFDGDEYELTRDCRPKEGVATPTTDTDYVQSVTLKVGHRLAGPQERDQLIREALPNEISRFFLFDGELLQEYEELLIESDTGARISAAIERILGVPILKQGRVHLTHLAEEAESEVAREAKKDQRTRAWAATLQQQSGMRTAQRGELERLKTELEGYEVEKTEQDQFLQSRQRYTSLLGERDDRDEALRDAQEAERDAFTRLRELMEGAWRGLLADPVKRALEAARESASEALSQVTLSMRADAVNNGVCEICNRPIDAADIERLKTTLPAAGAADHADSLADVAEALNRVASLAKFNNSDSAESIKENWRQIESARIEQVSARERIKEIDASVSGDLPEELRRSQRTRDRLIEQIHDHRTAIEKTEMGLEDLETAIGDLTKKIQATGGASGEMSSANARAEKLRAAAAVFDAAIEQYKHELRERVQDDASRFFLQMTTEPEDYAALQINESYGLQIVHKDGSIEYARSAGQEHVVALALMAALQRNAPIGGPIVMDSPFGRLDEGHTSKVIGTLPQMAKQAVLFVYHAEVDQDALRATLGDHLLREYRLNRISSRHTEIVEAQT